MDGTKMFNREVDLPVILLSSVSVSSAFSGDRSPEARDITDQLFSRLPAVAAVVASCCCCLPELSFRTIPPVPPPPPLTAPAEPKDNLSLFPDLSEMSLGGPVSDVAEIFSSSNSIGPTQRTR